MFRALRDGVPLLTVYHANQCGGPSFVDKESGQIHLGESRAEVKGQGNGVSRMEEEDDECRFSSKMWADNYWIFSDDKDMLTWMVNDIIAELTDVDMERKP